MNTPEGATTAPTFAVEENDSPAVGPRGYKKIHATGCRDLIDAEPVTGEAETRRELLTLLDGYGSAEDIDELDAYLAPCARRLLRG